MKQRKAYSIFKILLAVTLLGATFLAPISCNIFGEYNNPKDPKNTSSASYYSILSVSIKSLNFGSSNTSMTFSISNSGTGNLTWNVSESESWITSVSPASGTNSGTITVQVSRSGLSPGSYNGTISVTSNGGNQNVSVSMTVILYADLSINSLSVSPSTVTARSFTACSFNIVNNGPTALSSTVILVDYYLSSNTTFGDSDDTNIGDTLFTVSISSGSTYRISLSSTGLANMVRRWQTSQPSGNYYVFARVTITSSSPIDSNSSNNYVRTSSTIYWSWATIFSDGFEGAFPGSWLVGNNSGITTSKWGNNNAMAATGSWSAFCADNGNNSRTTYDNNLNTYMQRQNISLSGYSDAKIAFKLWLNSEDGYDLVQVNIRSQSGVWSNLFIRTGNYSSWSTITLDLTPYTGQSNLIISFDFVSDQNVVPSGTAGAWIDDVILTATN